MPKLNACAVMPRPGPNSPSNAHAKGSGTRCCRRSSAGRGCPPRAARTRSARRRRSHSRHQAQRTSSRSPGRGPCLDMPFVQDDGDRAVLGAVDAGYAHQITVDRSTSVTQQPSPDTEHSRGSDHTTRGERTAPVIAESESGRIAASLPIMRWTRCSRSPLSMVSGVGSSRGSPRPEASPGPPR